MILIENFNVRIVREGDRYGFNDCLVHDQAEPLVEFYDAKADSAFGPRGQFVSRYLLSTLWRCPSDGLQLEGGVPALKISENGMKEVRIYLAGFMRAIIS